jgi:C1A family cysteine protease
MFFLSSYLFRKKKFNVTFSSEEEKKQAAIRLNSVISAITENNKLYDEGKRNFKRKLYEFSHLSALAFSESYLGFIPNPQEPKISESPVRAKRSVESDLPFDCANIPPSINWAEKKKTSDVQSQGDCGCCYVFAAIAAVEATVAIEYKTEVLKLSAQHSLECMKNFTAGRNIGCKGGDPSTVWNLARQQDGFVAESSYLTYNAIDNGACVAGLKREPRTLVDHWEPIEPLNEEAMKCRLALYGPLTVALKVNETSFMTHEEGVWDDPENVCQNQAPDHVS